MTTLIQFKHHNSTSMRICLSFILIILFSGIQTDAFGQRRNPAKGADESFERKQYTIAAERYKKAYKKVKKNSDERNRISFRMAECYRLTGLYKRSEATYKRVMRSEFPKNNPEAYLFYAEVLKSNQKFDDAIANYEKYIQAEPDDPRGLLGAESTKLIKEWIDNPSKYEITLLKKINSRESDFAATWISENYNEIVFTSTRDNATGKEKDGYTGTDFSDLFTSKLDRKNEWSEPTLIDEEEIINTEGNEGTPFMNSSHNSMYFTRCENHTNRQSGCKIMVSSRSGRTWGEPVPVEIQGIDTLDFVGQPCLSESELIMYFVANRRGGFGGNDIWVTTRKSKKESFSRPLNIGENINTIGNEVFPFLKNDTTLYFASDGHGGMGGLDIFVATIDTAGNWGKPKNLKSPINSTADDFGIIFHPEEERGFFASNRDNVRGTDNLYYFVEPPVLFAIEGTVKDNQTLQYVENATIRLVGSDGSNISTRTNDKGYFLFGIDQEVEKVEAARTASSEQVKKNTTYEIIVDKSNYFTQSAIETTIGVEFSKKFTKNFDLEPIPEEPIVLPDILYDLARWELKPQYEDSLQGLIETLQINPTIRVELASHTDNRDTEEKNDILSQKRAQSVVDYLIIRGIEPGRLVAKGYGERSPRTLHRDYVAGGMTFAEGTILTEEYINSLASNDAKEAAHQLNRRTEFKVLSKDYVPRKSANNEVVIALNPEDNMITFNKNPDDLFVVSGIFNGYTENMVYEKASEAVVSPEKVLKMLKDGLITKDNFIGENIDKILTTGEVANNAEFTIKEIRMANRTAENVKFTVFKGLKYDIMIGQKFLNQFGEFQFDTKRRKLIFK